MKLKHHDYTVIEYTEDDNNDYALVIGNITKDKDTFSGAEIVTNYITNQIDLIQVREFLDIVEKEMGWIEINRLTTGDSSPDDMQYEIKSNTLLVTEHTRAMRR